jgi:hypothetical protein
VSGGTFGMGSDKHYPEEALPGQPTGNVWEWTPDWYQVHSETAMPVVSANPLVANGSARSEPARGPHSAQGDQGWLVSVCTELLSTSSGRACRKDRQQPVTLAFVASFANPCRVRRFTPHRHGAVRPAVPADVRDC